MSSAHVQKYEINDLDNFDVNPSNRPDETITLEDLQLPSIPEEISKQMAKVRGIFEAIQSLNDETHPVLDNLKRTRQEAQWQYDSFKAKRDDMWQKLDPATREKLENQIASNPNASVSSYEEPANIGFSEFMELVSYGQKTEQAKKELNKINNDIKSAISRKTESMNKEATDIMKGIDAPLNEFREKVLLLVLEKCEGFNNTQKSFLDNRSFLAKVIPVLLSYNLCWEEKSLWMEAEKIWNEKRPCVVQERKEKERLEQIAEAERKAKEELEQKRLSEELKALAVSGSYAGQRKTVVVKGVEFAFRWCPPGTFQMGELTSYDLERYSHKVTLTKGFWMMEPEVTQKQWTAIMGDNPSDTKSDDLPINRLSWYDCEEFCEKSSKLGFRVKLPTEAQWEYACRAGSKNAKVRDLDGVAWYKANSGDKLHPVGTKKPNEWGLYDMLGNAEEWCHDRYKEYPWEYYNPETGLSTGGSMSYRVKEKNSYLGGYYYSDRLKFAEKRQLSATDPTGPISGSDRVFRGGRYWDDDYTCNYHWRNGTSPSSSICGFRCVIVP